MAEATIPGHSGEMTVHVAIPEGTGPWPGIVIVHDALGMTSDLRNQASWLASEGYIAAAPDLYYGGGKLRCMFSAMRQAVARKGGIFDDLDATRAWLTGRDDCDGRIAVIGFCMGGGFALLLASMGGYRASSVNYGAVPKDAMTLLADACPIVGSYGARDLTLRKAPGRLEHAMSVHGIPHDIKVYPDAGHAFLNRHDPADAPKWALVMSKFTHSDYHEPAAADARRRIIAFFDAQLKPGH
jgi:carboxymethylenebutenolidase